MFAVFALALSIYVALSLLAFLIVMAALVAGSRQDAELLHGEASQQRRRVTAAPVGALGG